MMNYRNISELFSGERLHVVAYLALRGQCRKTATRTRSVGLCRLEPIEMGRAFCHNFHEHM
jgi:hypothetical protein